MTESINPQATTDVVIVHSPKYANWVFDPAHPTQGRRFINGYNEITKLLPEVDFLTVEPRLATREELALVHTQNYISQVLDQHSCNEWDEQRPDLSELASAFVGGTLTALDYLLEGKAHVAVHLPGAKHHAQADKSSGFCVFADFAIAAKIAVARGYKVAIFDYDAHHGDGTENLCADDPNILTYSVHEKGLFPWTGNESDPSRNIYNRALDIDFLNSESWGEDRINFRHDEALIDAAGEFARLAEKFGADIIFLAAGADGHADDRMSRLQYHTNLISKAISGIFHSNLAQLPVLIGGAGGYRPDDATPQMWAEAVYWTHDCTRARATRAMQSRPAGENV